MVAVLMGAVYSLILNRVPHGTLGGGLVISFRKPKYLSLKAVAWGIFFIYFLTLLCQVHLLKCSVNLLCTFLFLYLFVIRLSC